MSARTRFGVRVRLCRAECLCVGVSGCALRRRFVRASGSENVLINTNSFDFICVYVCVFACLLVGWVCHGANKQRTHKTTSKTNDEQTCKNARPNAVPSNSLCICACVLPFSHATPIATSAKQRVRCASEAVHCCSASKPEREAATNKASGLHTHNTSRQ